MKPLLRMIELLAVLIGGAGMFVANGPPKMPALGLGLVGVGLLLFLACEAWQRVGNRQ